MAYIAGRVNEHLEALVTVHFLAGREVECLLDTGFSGSLVLPASLVTQLGLPVFGHETNLRTIGGRSMSADLALAQINWLGEVRSVVVIVEEEFLIGTQLLDDARLIVDYRARTLTIENGEPF